MAFICLLCRQVGHKTVDCPEAGKPQGTVVPGPNAAVFPGIHGADLSSGHIESSPLCSRCADLKLLDMLLCEDVKDEFAGELEDVISNKEITKTKTLGPFRSIELLDTCPLCRMLFGAFPPEDAEVDPESSYSLRPILTYNLTGVSMDPSESDFFQAKNYTKQELDALRQSYAVLAYIVPDDARARVSIQTLVNGKLDNKYQTFFGIAGPRVQSAPCSIPAAPPKNNRTALAPRPRATLIDFGLINSWLDKCNTECSDCRGIWRDELLTTRMLDVVDNKLVDCPPHCQYVALSYVWGGVVPEPDALDKGTLPPTIMDAMEVTRRIGVRHLWVDALCIDQRPTAQKMQQIRIMDLIYEGAYLTIVALHGDSSLYGLPGVTDPAASYAQAVKQKGRSVPLSSLGRATQPYELVDGYPMAVVYPGTFYALSSTSTTYTTRAWTLQEHYLSRRQLLFDREQVHFDCRVGGPQETIDDAYDPAQIMSALTSIRGSGHQSVVQLQHNLSPPYTPSIKLSPEDVQVQQLAVSMFTGLLDNYTSRYMADARDSLNAFSGLVSYSERSANMQPFVWGLPLRDYPLSLTWFHERNKQSSRGNRDKIKRRRDFPSWSYTGWEGRIAFPTPASQGLNHIEPDLIRDEMVERGIECGMAPVFVSIGHVGTAPPLLPYPQVDGKVLTLKGYTVRLEIKSEPFNEAYVPGTDVNIGMLLENDYLHPLTLPSGVFDFVVACRIKQVLHSPERPVRHTLYLIMLDDSEAAQNGGVPSRRTFVRWTVDGDFSKTDRYNDMLCYKEDIQIV